MRNNAVPGAILALSVLAAAGCGGGEEPGVAERAAGAAVRGVDRAHAQRTRDRLDTLRTALDRYAIDHDGTYPRGVSLEAIAGDLVPLYLTRMETTDAWGGTMTYDSDGRSYTIVAPGEDGRHGTADDAVLRDGFMPGVP